MELAALAPEYQRLFNTCQTRDASAAGAIANRFPAFAPAYAPVVAATGVPAHVIFLVHHLEADLSFQKHLHNGDSLRRPTVNDPAGRPPKWKPAIPPSLADFQASAIDALRFDRLDQIAVWDVAGIAFALEKYNGWGYRKHGIADPYLWSGSQHYERGKYVSDGRFDPDAVSSQIGGMVILHELTLRKLVALPGIPV
jgi:lysozyme family protein